MCEAHKLIGFSPERRKTASLRIWFTYFAYSHSHSLSLCPLAVWCLSINKLANILTFRQIRPKHHAFPKWCGDGYVWVVVECRHCLMVKSFINITWCAASFISLCKLIRRDWSLLQCRSIHVDFSFIFFIFFIFAAHRIRMGRHPTTSSFFVSFPFVCLSLTLFWLTQLRFSLWSVMRLSCSTLLPSHVSAKWHQHTLNWM